VAGRKAKQSNDLLAAFMQERSQPEWQRVDEGPRHHFLPSISDLLQLTRFLTEHTLLGANLRVTVTVATAVVVHDEHHRSDHHVFCPTPSPPNTGSPSRPCITKSSFAKMPLVVCGDDLDAWQPSHMLDLFELSDVSSSNGTFYHLESCMLHPTTGLSFPSPATPPFRSS
jgi:hypothetical protein